MLFVHRIRQGWARGLDTSVLAFDVAQFYPSVNHRMLLGILRKQGFSAMLVNFLEQYLSGRSTAYRWDVLTSPLFAAVDVGVVQGSSLSPPLANLYIAPVIHRLCTTSSDGTGGHPWLQFFVDDGLWSVSRADLDGNVSVLRDEYRRTIAEFDRVGLRVEHEKTEACHFSPPFTGDTPLKPVPVLRHLGFYLDKKMTFRAHVRFYGARAASTAQSLLMLGNSIRGMPPAQRRTLYKSLAKDALTVTKMNVNPGGKNVPDMHDTIVPADNMWGRGGYRQTMQFDAVLPDDDEFKAYEGQPKGIRRILHERGLLKRNMIGDCKECKQSKSRKAHVIGLTEEELDRIDEDEEVETEDEDDRPTDCCMRLSSQDFKDEKSLLEKIIEEAGDVCHFLPKFHPELNPIDWEAPQRVIPSEKSIRAEKVHWCVNPYAHLRETYALLRADTHGSTRISADPPGIGQKTSNVFRTGTYGHGGPRKGAWYCVLARKRA
ncbi:hypothetical protein VTO73DRAFT_1878 [Trametes versicolor]